MAIVTDLQNNLDRLRHLNYLNRKSLLVKETCMTCKSTAHVTFNFNIQFQLPNFKLENLNSSNGREVDSKGQK